MSENVIKSGANVPNGRKYRQQSGPLDTYQGAPMKQTKTAEEAMQETPNKPPEDTTAGQTDGTGTSTQPGGEKVQQAASQGISVIPELPRRPITKQATKKETGLQRERRLRRSDKVYVAALIEYAEKLASSKISSEQLEQLNDELAAANVMYANLQDQDSKHLQTIARIRSEVKSARNRVQELERLIERANDPDRLANQGNYRPGAEFIAELPEDLTVILTNEGKDPAFLIAGVRGFHAGLYIVMRPDTGNSREKCLPGDEPQNIRAWRALGYHSEVVFGLQMLKDRVAWYQQLEETPMPRV